MTFEQHLQAEMKRLEEAQHDGREAGQARQILLPLRDSLAIQHHLRAILLASGEQSVE
jgi:hypothetical protein